MTEPDKPLDLGQFRGFPMQVQLKGEKFVVTMKQNLTYTAELADEILGNVTRILYAQDVEDLRQGYDRVWHEVYDLIRKFEGL